MMRSCALLALFVVIAPGCSKNSGKLPALHPLKGQILRGGTPVNGGFVTFTPAESADYAVTASVGADGRFTASTMSADDKEGRKSPGAPAGSYRVLYSTPGNSQEVSTLTAPKLYTVEAGKENDLIIEFEEKK